MNEKTKQEIMRKREELKGYGSWDVGAEETDQEQGLPPIPSIKKGNKEGLIKLPMDRIYEDQEGPSLMELFRDRESLRTYDPCGMTLSELSWLLWATQGIRKTMGSRHTITFRNSPSAGCRHPLETYLFLNQVEGIEKGIYHYLPMDHALELVGGGDYKEALLEGVCGQQFVLDAAAVFVWSALPYRTEWRYGKKAMKFILLDAGHVCGNLYLAAEAAGLGCCAIGAYDQECMDELLGFPLGPSAERDYECTVYLATVGKKKQS